MDRGMSLPTGRRTKRVRSWGLVRKRGKAGRQVARFEPRVLGVCRIGGLLQAHHSGEQHSHQVSASVHRLSEYVKHEQVAKTLRNYYGGGESHRAAEEP